MKYVTYKILTSLLLTLIIFSSPAMATTQTDIEVVCAICGGSSTQYVMMSTSTFGYSDLDLRPPPIQRYSMHLWIQRCPHCGYCAPSIDTAAFVVNYENDETSDFLSEITDFIGSEMYKSQLINTDYPDLANQFLSWGMISEHLELYENAFFAYLRAAWVCDDEQNENALECRLKALRIYDSATKDEGVLIDQDTDKCLAIDLMRRVGQFDSAIALCDSMLVKEIENDIIRAIVEYQKDLAEAADVDSHNIGEIEGIEEIIQ